MHTPLRNAASGGGFQDTAGRELKPKRSLSQWTVQNKKDGTSEDVRQEGPAPPEVHEMKAS